MSIGNVFEPEWEEERNDDGFHWRRAQIGRQVGAVELGASIYEVQPQGSTFPLHAHFSNEEMLFVLSGSPTLVTLEGDRELASGEVVAFRAGREGSHRIDNRTGEVVRILILSTMKAPEITAMLESGGYWIRDYPPGADPAGGSLDERL